MSELDEISRKRFDDMTEIETCIVMADVDYDVKLAAAQKLKEMKSRLEILEEEHRVYINAMDALGVIAEACPFEEIDHG